MHPVFVFYRCSVVKDEKSSYNNNMNFTARKDPTDSVLGTLQNHMLTHWGLNEMADILQTTYSNVSLKESVSIFTDMLICVHGTVVDGSVLVQLMAWCPKWVNEVRFVLLKSNSNYILGIAIKHLCISCIRTQFSSTLFQSLVFNQWETTLQCNVVTHWLSQYPEWSLHIFHFYKVSIKV